MNTIQSQWESFLKDVVPEDAEQVQITETQKAFYGGIAALLSLQLKMVELSDDAGLMLMESWTQELDEFIEQQGE